LGRVVVIGSGKLGHLSRQALGLTGCGLLVIAANAATLGLLAAGACARAPRPTFPPARPTSS